MKNKKCALGLVAMLAAVMGLTACDQTTSSTTGSIFTYTDARGVRTSYTAEDLMANYRKSGSSLSTEFDKVYEVLVRNYFKKSQPAELAELQQEATRAVASDKETAQKNASSNKTTYEAEFEKILTNKNVKNVDELYQLELYSKEKDKFNADIYQNWGVSEGSVSGLNTMKNGYVTNADETPVLNADGSYKYVFHSADGSNEWGINNDGWLKEQMPYHTRHILVKFASGKTGEFTQDKIGESTTAGEGGETTNLGSVVMALAGANYETAGDATTHTTTVSSVSEGTRQTFGTIAKSRSEDTGSAAEFGDVGILTKVMSSNDYVHEYKLGMYAYESLYNQREKQTEWGKENAYRLAPGLTEDAKSISDIDDNQVLDDSGTTVASFFQNYTYPTTTTDTETGIGQIPFGAAVALLDYAKVVKDKDGNVVNEGNEAFYPRNVIFNKYFNKHNVCVITPNAIWSNKNSTNSETKLLALTLKDQPGINQDIIHQDFVGHYTSEYGSLPGFQKDTTNVLPQFAHNVLTDETGNVILAVRVSSSGYQGMHFIVVQRSALSQYGLTASGSQMVENSSAVTTADQPTLSQYYTTQIPDQSADYPTYTTASGSKADMTTYANYNKQLNVDITKRAGIVSTDIQSYNSSLSSYLFEKLVSEGSIKFNDATLESEMKVYSTTKRLSTKNDNFTSWKNAWKEYAEVLEAQEEARAVGMTTGKGTLLSETAAVEFALPSAYKTTELWAKGGACYYGTK